MTRLMRNGRSNPLKQLGAVAVGVSLGPWQIAVILK
jgi:hypothetical protein